MNAEQKLETVTCSRCGGTGHYSYNQITGTVCFKCNGGKIVYTKRGRAAADFLHALRCKPASEIKVGDLVQQDFGSPLGRQVRAFGRVVKSELSDSFCTSTSNGVTQKFQHWLLELSHAKLGGVSKYTFPNDMVRVGWTGEQKKEQFRKALEFQATLGKNGKPSAKALKAAEEGSK